MHILHVVPTYYPAIRYGGPIRSVHGLAVALAQRGHSVEVCTTSMDGPMDLDVPEDRAVPLDGIQVRYFRVTRARRLSYSPPLDAFLRHAAKDFDIIHLHSVFQLPTYYAARAAQRAGVPYVASPRGMLMAGAIEGKNPWLKRAWIKAVEQRTYRHASLVHVTAQLEADELAQFGIDPRKICVIENGLDLPPQVAPLASGPYTGLPRPYALFLSRISWKKGLDRLIRAWRQVQDLHLVVAGNDDERYQHKIEALVRSEGLSDRVSFVGPASDADKWALYESSELFVLPSYAENFGNVVIEAMAMGRAVVVSDAVGAAHIVAEAQAGRVNDGDSTSIARDINELHANPGMRQAMGERGRTYVVQHLGWPAIGARMEQQYARTIEMAGAAPRA